MLKDDNKKKYVLSFGTHRCPSLLPKLRIRSKYVICGDFPATMARVGGLGMWKAFFACWKQVTSCKITLKHYVTAVLILLHHSNDDMCEDLYT